ncbi:Cytochrome P450 4c3 [Gryllus bimaculatus]|nr:Cytochrome P450 4c3 [Gryllus bimaculatus]
MGKDSAMNSTIDVDDIVSRDPLFGGDASWRQRRMLSAFKFLASHVLAFVRMRRIAAAPGVHGTAVVREFDVVAHAQAVAATQGIPGPAAVGKSDVFGAHAQAAVARGVPGPAVPGVYDCVSDWQRRRVAFLDLLLLAARDGSLSDADIREEVDTFMFEGQDTTEAALSFAIYLLASHPDVQEKVLEELKSVFDWSQPLQPTIQQLGELKYLEMVIKEVLRLYPSVPAIFRDITEDDKLPSTGHVIPDGTVMIVSPWAVHRNPEVYPDPEKFDPERFSAGETARRHPYAFLPFSAGPRNCIGEAHAQFVVLQRNGILKSLNSSNDSWLPLTFTSLRLPALQRRPAQLHRREHNQSQRFAMLEMKSVLAKVIWNFEMFVEPGFTVLPGWKLILKPVNGVRIRLDDRRKNYDNTVF